MNEKQVQTAPKRNPYTIWFVVLSFVAPVVVAYVMFFFGDVSKFTNRGEILNPIVDITALELKDETGSLLTEKALRFKWRFISFVGSDCDEACNQRLYDSRQVHKSLGKNQHRVIRMVVHLEPAVSSLTSLMEKDYPNALNVYGNEKTISTALGASANIRQNELYIMDPMGNVMMRFTQDQPKKDIQRDVGKLLKASQIG